MIAFSSAPLLAQTAAPAPEVEWVDAKKLTVEGLGFKDVKSPYDRLPVRAEGVVPPAVWNLSRDSAGALVRFTAATTEIQARWTVTNKNLAGANITAIAWSGLDLYAKTDSGKWRWLGFGQPTFPDATAASTACSSVFISKMGTFASTSETARRMAAARRAEGFPTVRTSTVNATKSEGLWGRLAKNAGGAAVRMPFTLLSRTTPIIS